MAIQFANATRPTHSPHHDQQSHNGFKPRSTPEPENHRSNRVEHSSNEHTRRSIFRTASFASFDINKTIGWRIRDFVASCEEKLGPYLKWIFPSFIAAHYFYVIFMVILCSVLIYPVKNMNYIDALFFATGTSTQAGLNTIDINDISLYQQIVIYIVCCLTTPIFIHSSLCFLRLYWFERYFDNIRSSSKLNFKMRRAATLMERQKTIESQGDDLINARGSKSFNRSFSFGLKKSNTKNSARKMSNIPPDSHGNSDINEEIHNVTPKEELSSTSSVDQANNVSPISYTKSAADLYSSLQSHRTDLKNLQSSHGTRGLDEDEMVIHHSEPSDTEDEDFMSNKGIKFASNLPRPSRERQEVTPRDMYVSISMLRSQNHDQKEPDIHNHHVNQKLLKEQSEGRSSPKMDQNLASGENHEDFDENEGPTLIIRGPAEREIQFAEPTKQKKRKQATAKDSKPKFFERKISGLTAKQLLKIDDQRRDSSSCGNQIPDDKHQDDFHGLNSIDDALELKRSQSQLQLPSKDQTGGVRFTKRSNTMDPIAVLPGGEQKMNIFGSSERKQSFNRRHSSAVFTDDEESTGGSSIVENVHDQENSFNDGETDDGEFSPNILQRTMSTNYLSWVPQVGRNSTFVNLTDQQKEELGGVEYRALKMLVKILIAYYVGFHILAVLFLVPWIWQSEGYRNIVNSYAIETSWWGFFTGMSAFTDLGFTLTANSMSSFNTSTYVLLVMSFFIVVGNTGFPILLRFIIWVMFKISRDLSLMKESLGFLLDHPRRCFTLLFPSAPTWWLLFILLVLNAIDLILFIVLDINSAVLESLSTGYKILDGFFQAVSTRTAGFTCVDLSQLHPSVQVSYMVMMYISVLPIAISIRRTNVYEEQSLGIFAVTSQGHLRRSSTMIDDDRDIDENEHTKASSFIGAHLRKQLSFDLWFIVMGVFIICVAEGEKIQDVNAGSFDIWHILFEVVSAYGTVGLSLGFPGTNTSFSAQLNVVSKLVIILMMIRGRHRGLPYSLDRAIMLPSKQMERRDMVQDLHNRAESLDLSQQGHSYTLDTAHSGANHDPVLQFFKSVTPDPIRKHIRRPSVFKRTSTAGTNLQGSRKFSTAGRTSVRSHSTIIKEQEEASDYFSHQHRDRNSAAGGDQDDELRRETKPRNDFKNIHFNHGSALNLDKTSDPIEYEMDNLNTLDGYESKGMKIVNDQRGDLGLRVYETYPEAQQADGLGNIASHTVDIGKSAGDMSEFGDLQRLDSHYSV